jgi:hypothetical protein
MGHPPGSGYKPMKINQIKIYKRLLKLYPEEFQREYSPLLIDAFRLHFKETKSFSDKFLLWSRFIPDIIKSVLIERKNISLSESSTPHLAAFQRLHFLFFKFGLLLGVSIVAYSEILTKFAPQVFSSKFDSVSTSALYIVWTGVALFFWRALKSYRWLNFSFVFSLLINLSVYFLPNFILLQNVTYNLLFTMPFMQFYQPHTFMAVGMVLWNVALGTFSYMVLAEIWLFIWLLALKIKSTFRNSGRMIND